MSSIHDISDDDDDDDNNMTASSSMFSVSRPSRLPNTLPSSITWTRQFQVHPLENDTSDKILLPPSALEQLISSTTDLPQPLTFRLLNLKTNMYTHVGVREFSAEQNTIHIPSWILSSLSLAPLDFVALTFRPLPKASRVKLRPLEAGYIQDDWKALLEAHLRNHTTLTKGEIVSIRVPSRTFRFLVDELEPSEAVNLIDTDMTTEIEELSEDNARQTQNERVNAARKRIEVTDILIDQELSGSVDENEYTYFRVRQWDKNKPVECITHSEGDIDLLLSTSEDWKPTLDMSIWSDMSYNTTKRIFIAESNVELVHASTLLIGVHGNTNAQFTLTVHQSNTSANIIVANAHSPGFIECQNCLSWVPERSIILHQNFCLRNNFHCQECDTILPKQQQSQHWHCQECSTHGNSLESYNKHRATNHTERACVCNESFPSLMALGFHRATTCSQKLIKCRFCQMLLPQGDISTLSTSSLLAGLTPHESDCGSRTTECSICNSRFLIKDMGVHLQWHDSARKLTPAPLNCRNMNCTRAKAGNVLGLCTICFGPLYSPLNDPGHKKLTSRVERRILMQGMSGCGRSGCNNSLYCATASGRKKTMTEMQPVVRDITKDMLSGNGAFYFCVDESIQRRAFLAGMISAEGNYDLEWARRGIEEGRGDLGRAREWLERNARRKDE